MPWPSLRPSVPTHAYPEGAFIIIFNTIRLIKIIKIAQGTHRWKGVSLCMYVYGHNSCKVVKESPLIGISGVVDSSMHALHLCL